MVKLHATEYTPLVNENEKGLYRQERQRIGHSLPSQRVLALVIVFETVLIICGVLSVVTVNLIENAAGRSFIPQRVFVNNNTNDALYVTWPQASDVPLCRDLRTTSRSDTISPQFEGNF